MSVFYPQAAIVLRVLWEDFKLASDATLQEVYKLPILARSVTVNINDYTQADTFTAEIDYKSFPFDPRCIRSCGVSVFMQDMQKVFRQDNRLNILEPSADNIVFQGFVDEEQINFDDDKRVVRLEGRDFTSLFLDRKRVQQTPIDLTSPLDQVILSLIRELKEANDISVDNRTGQTTFPALAKFASDLGQHSGKKNPKKDETYWDIIQDIVLKAGLIAYIELDKLVLATPRTIYDKTKAINFVYGKNLKTLEYKRKLGRHKGFNILVRSLDFEAKDVIEAKIPAEAQASWAQATGVTNTEVKIPTINPNGEKGEDKVAPYISFRVANVANKDRLIEIGQNIYEELSRQQIEGKLSTHEMCAPQGQFRNKAETLTEFNLLKLRIGSPLQIEIDQDDLARITRFKNTEERYKYLIFQCYEPKVARALAETLGKFNSFMFTKAVTYTVDADNGFTVNVEFINFIEISNKLLS